MKALPALWLGALFCLPQIGHADAYRCKQANGTVAFQDHPCQAGTAGTMVALPPVQGYAPSKLGAASGNAGKPGQAAADDATARTNAYNRQIEAENKNLRCNEARQQLGVLKEQRPVYSRNNAGDRVYMEDKDRPAALAAAERRVASDCP